MAEQDAQLLQILIRQVGQDRLVDPVLSENRLVLLEVKAPQPPSEVHADALFNVVHKIIARKAHSDQRFMTRSKADIGEGAANVRFPPKSRTLVEWVRTSALCQ